MSVSATAKSYHTQPILPARLRTAIVLLFASLLSACEKPVQQYDYTIFAFGTLIDITLYDVSKKQADTDLIMRNLVLMNQVVFGSVNAGRESYENAVKDIGTFIEKWPEATKKLITGRYPMKSFKDLLFGEPGGIKNVITF